MENSFRLLKGKWLAWPQWGGSVAAWGVAAGSGEAVPAGLEMNWEILDVIVSGRSAIDAEQSLGLLQHQSALEFLSCYGYDLENSIERAELFGNFQEALNFIRAYFLYPQNQDGMRLEVPRKIQELSDPVQLFLWSSQGSQGTGASSSQLHLWSCAVLKVMHTISHMDKDLRTSYFPDIQKQVLDRIYKWIQNVEGRLFLGAEPSRRKEQALQGLEIELVAFETKPKKSRESVLIKLLQKPENVAEDIFDRVGVRFVTKTKYDALRVISFLKQHHVIMPANIKPSRSRNTLVDVERFKQEQSKVMAKLRRREISTQDAIRGLSEFCEQQGAIAPSENPHSSREYASIQFTCRHLVKIVNPLYDELRKLKALAKADLASGAQSEVMQRLEMMDLKNMQREIRFFYPFEIQVCDEKSHQENIAGASAHSAYKKSQLQSAMKRVMRGLSSS